MTVSYEGNSELFYFSDATLCIMSEVQRRFGGAYSHHLQDLRLGSAGKQKVQEGSMLVRHQTFTRLHDITK